MFRPDDRLRVGPVGIQEFGQSRPYVPRLERNPVPHFSMRNKGDRVIRRPEQKSAKTANVILPDCFIPQAIQKATRDVMFRASHLRRPKLMGCRMQHPYLDTPSYIQTKLRDPVAFAGIHFIHHRPHFRHKFRGHLRGPPGEKASQCKCTLSMPSKSGIDLCFIRINQRRPGIRRSSPVLALGLCYGRGFARLVERSQSTLDRVLGIVIRVGFIRAMTCDGSHDVEGIVAAG